MRILYVANFFPWPAANGGLIRSSTAVEALAELGGVDLFALIDQRLHDGRGPEEDVPSGVAVSRVGAVPYPQIGPSLRWRAAWLAQGRAPMEIVMRRSDPAPRTAFERWAADRYDLAWFATPGTFDWLGRPALGPTVVDLDGLEGSKERRRARTMRVASTGHGAGGVARRSLAAAQARLNARDWDSFQRSVARDVDRVLFCSTTEVTRSGLANAEAVTNTYPRPTRPLGRRHVGDPPTILFQGTFDYAPNVDAAEWLVDEIAPRIRALVPGARIRLVGRTTSGLDRLNRPPEATVVGRVPAMEPELARADLAVVPLRFGSGTRLKLLESFAHRIPVVSTTMGAEGLDVVDGVHLLLADDPDAMATAGERLLTDLDLRHRIVDAAEQRYLERYESSVAHESVRRLATDVSGAGTGDG
ncbi:MAG TPA: glycosyltransferase [Acidimicrobiales bacterium]|jgi:glycosyltransferase involved in cell wall biosynthesis|nr:glycosyltransferase [Acidimicrobiales bacterium]